MSASIKPKCPYCGSYFMSHLGTDGLKKCLDCKREFSIVKLSKEAVKAAKI